jgi:hypothetical protein
MQTALAQETFGKLVEVSDGFWVLATRHRPGFSKMMPEVNNRCLVFRLQEHGKPLLFVANASVDVSGIPEVKALEARTGLTVEYLLSPGGGHHLQLPAWRAAFAHATVLVPPVRIPRTARAAPLMKGERVQVMAVDDPLPQFHGQLECVIFAGLVGFSDRRTPFEGGKESFFTMLATMKEMMSLKTPVDEVWLYHPASGTVIAGENLGWILSADTVKRFPLMMRGMFKPNAIVVNDKARRVSDREQTAAAWRKVLAWPSRTLMGYHEPPGEAFFGDGQSALRAAVQAAKQL